VVPPPETQLWRIRPAEVVAAVAQQRNIQFERRDLVAQVLAELEVANLPSVILGGPIRSLVDAVILQPPFMDWYIAPSVDTAEKSAIWTSK
jgi:uncharacterized membrane protein